MQCAGLAFSEPLSRFLGFFRFSLLTSFFLLEITFLMKLSSCLTAVALLLVAAPAAAQDEVAPPVAAPRATPEVKTPGVSIALERVGGVAYAKGSVSGDNSSAESAVSVTGFGIGGATPNPFAIPRVGVDFILPSNLTLGGAVGFSHLSASTSEKSSSGTTRETDVGSVFLYTLTPRVGYRIALSDRVDLTPRAGLTLAGASVSPADGDNKASIFAVAIGADAPFAFRLTDSFNLLAGAALDYTVSATATTTSTSTTRGVGPGGQPIPSSTSTRSDDVKGSLFSMQAWIGLGGYL